MGKHDVDRDGQGTADPEKWENAGDKGDGDEHEDTEGK